jgi:hypothetical protein
MHLADREAMGRRGRELIEAEFTWAPVARTLVTAYRDYASATCV